MIHASIYSSSSTILQSERRNTSAPLFTLLEVDPRDVVDGKIIDGWYYAENVQAAGHMRERCPYCGDVALQLVLRYRHVKRSHLFCPCCTRCYDALYPDGTSALIVGAMTLY
jgi:hypothetical protein